MTVVNTRMVWVDTLRIIAGISMVGLHASSDINGQPFPDSSTWERTWPVLFRSVMYLARTELFIIISLFLLFMSISNRPRGYGSIIFDQSKKLLRPFLFWVIFYAFYRLIKASYFGYEDAILAQLSSPVDWLGYILLGDVQYHMHFLPTLFGLLIFYPVCLSAIEKPWIGIIVILCLFAKREVDIWLWAHAADIPAQEYLVRVIKILTYIGYGYVAAAAFGIYKRMDNGIGTFEYFKSILFVGIILYSLKLVYSFRVIEHGNWQFNYVPGYWADFLMPVVLFFVFMSSRTIAKYDWLSHAAPYSFGVYLVHPIFLDIAEIALWNTTLSPMAYILLKVIWAIFMSCGFIMILKKSKLLGWIVGIRPFPKLSEISRFMRFKMN